MTNKNPILFWIWLMMLVAYLDRVNIAVAGPTMMAALHMSKAVFGWVGSSFQFGYALLQIPGGYLADRFGARLILVTALSVWSVFTALTGTARSVASLIAIRILFGAGEGIENGAQFKLIGDSFPSKERSNANALFLTALALGPALAAPLSTWIIAHYGWRQLFYSFAVLGLIVAALLFLFLPKPTPDEIVRESTNEPAQTGSWRSVMGQRPTWLAFAAYLFFNIAFWGYLTWMPSYLSLERHITLKNLGTLASIPYLCGFVGMLALGRLGSRSLLHRRAALIAASYLLAASVFLYVTYSASSVASCLIGLSLAAFFLYGGFGPFWAIALDLIAADKRGAFSGFVNFGGQIGGFIAPAAVGELVTLTKSFTAGFLFMIAGLVLSAVSLLWLQLSERYNPIASAS